MTELTWRQAIERVLGSSPVPLDATQITERIIADGLRKNLGQTPSATVQAQLAASIKHDGDRSPYVRVAKGVFALKSKWTGGVYVRPDGGEITNEIPGAEDQYDVVTSFGMFWKRESIEWTASPRLLGMQQIGAESVDFHQQRGIYLLYDGREVIYVGRTTDRPLGKRLYEHTLDRFAARWDRFSWFGLLPVSEKGRIGTLPDQYEAGKLIPALEAILIEALEPRQNRKRGDDLAAVEYLQTIDPQIRKKLLKAQLDLL